MNHRHWVPHEAGSSAETKARDESNELVLQRMAFLELQIGPGAEIAAERMKSFLRQAMHELSNARDATLILAIVASFIAWIITQHLRVAFGQVTSPSFR
jgi:hypothetical protein